MVIDRDGEVFRQRLAHAQRLHRRVAVGQAVAPALAAAHAATGGGDRAQAEAAVAGHAGEAGRVHVGDVQVGEGHRAAGQQRAVFDHAACLRRAGDHDLVIRAGDGDHQVLHRAVAHLDRIGHGDCLAQRQEVEVHRRRVVGVPDALCGTAVGRH